MLETDDDLVRLQDLLEHSSAAAGPHLSEVLTEERRMTAAEVTHRLQGMCLLVAATTTADGRPLVGPVDGYLLHGEWHFSSSRDSVRIRHLYRRPAVSVSHVPGEHLAVTVHGRAELYDLADPDRPELRQAMLDHYLPRQGPAFAEALDALDAVAVRVEASRMYTFRMD